MPNDDLNLNQLDKELRIFIQHNVYLGIVFEALTSVPIEANKLNFQPFRPTDRPTDPRADRQAQRELSLLIIRVVWLHLGATSKKVVVLGFGVV